MRQGAAPLFYAFHGNEEGRSLRLFFTDALPPGFSEKAPVRERYPVSQFASAVSE